MLEKFFVFFILNNPVENHPFNDCSRQERINWNPHQQFSHLCYFLRLSISRPNHLKELDRILQSLHTRLGNKREIYHIVDIQRLQSESYCLQRLVVHLSHLPNASPFVVFLRV